MPRAPSNLGTPLGTGVRPWVLGTPLGTSNLGTPLGTGFLSNILERLHDVQVSFC